MTIARAWCHGGEPPPLDELEPVLQHQPTAEPNQAILVSPR